MTVVTQATTDTISK